MRPALTANPKPFQNVSAALCSAAGSKSQATGRFHRARAFVGTLGLGLPILIAGCSATDFQSSGTLNPLVRSSSIATPSYGQHPGSVAPHSSGSYTAPHFAAATQSYQPQYVPTDQLMMRPWDRFENPTLRVLQEMALRNAADPVALYQRVANAKGQRGGGGTVSRDQTQLRRDLLQEVAMLSAQVHRAQRLLLSAARNRERQTEGLNQANVRLQVGTVGRLEVEQFKTMLAQTQSKATLHHQALDTAARRLRDLIGQPLTGAIVHSLNDQPQLHLRDVDSKLPAQILRRRCDVRSAEEHVTQLGRQAGIPEAELFPHLGLKGEIRASEQPPLDNSSSEFDESLLALDGSALGIDLGTQRSWQFMTPASDLGKSSQFRTPLQRSMGGYHQAVTLAADEVKNWLTNYVHSRRRVETLKNATADAEEALRLTMQQFQADRIKGASVVVAQQQLMNSEERLIEAEYQLAICAVELFIAVGGQCHQDRFPEAELYEKSL